MIQYRMEKGNKIQPLFDRVLLKHMVEQQTGAGIILPRSTDDRSQIMTVASVPLDPKASPCVKVGDRVIVAKYAGTEVNFGGEKFVLACEYDLLAVISAGDSGVGADSARAVVHE